MFGHIRQKLHKIISERFFPLSNSTSFLYLIPLIFSTIADEKTSKFFPAHFFGGLKIKCLLKCPHSKELACPGKFWLHARLGYFCNTVIVGFDLYCSILSLFSWKNILLRLFIFVLLFLSDVYLESLPSIDDGAF